VYFSFWSTGEERTTTTMKKTHKTPETNKQDAKEEEWRGWKTRRIYLLRRTSIRLSVWLVGFDF
jgi:hypothetical protein